LTPEKKIDHLKNQLLKTNLFVHDWTPCVSPIATDVPRRWLIKSRLLAGTPMFKKNILEGASCGVGPGFDLE
jgi:hypothetical protein